MKFKALQIAALLGAVSGASALLVSASAPAQAGEQRLHSSSSATYGLIPPGQKGAERGSLTTKSTTSKSASNSQSAGKPGSTSGSASEANASNDDGPQLEDPGMPAYDGGAGAGGPSV